MIQWQLIRLFFEVAERYVILCVLTYCAPLAFAMGGSKSTSDIFRGWLRMFASMCVLMVFNLVFVKLVLSALSTDPNGAAIIPWAMLVVGIVRMAKKMDGIILRIGMNPALTGDPLGTHFPGALTAMTLRSIASIVTHTAAKNTPSAGHGNTSGPPPQGDPVLRGGMAGGAARPASGASGKTSSAQSAAGQKNTALSSAAVNGAGSGARVAGTMAAFHSRYGTDNAGAMQQVRQAISIDADDWDNASYTGSSVVQSGTSQTVSGTGSRVMPPAPPMRPLPAAQPIGRVTPVPPSITAGGASQAREDTVPVTSTAAVTAAATAGSMASSHTDKSRISPAREAPPQAMRPVSGSAVSPARQQTASAGRQAPSAASARVTPAQRPAVTPAASPQVQAQPSAKMQPNITPADRRPAVTPARRERRPERTDSASRLDVNPGVRTPDMVTPPPTSQPRTLRRSAQPLKNKAAPETPKRGGTHNRKRKRKK